ncbi:MAG: translocation/assembly module TamB [Spirochaetaceae bacterium]|jgi:hypothetical protein|nr:translocation/assembly module TamB [Spirochaetaceae bacterium]
MRSKLVKLSILVALAVGIAALAVFLIQPIYVRLQAYLEEYRDGIIQRLEEETGARVSYGAISPAILTGLRIRDNAVYDGTGGVPLVTIHSAALFYRLGDLLAGRLEGAFTELRISDVAVDYGAFRRSAASAKILGLVKRGGTKNTVSVPAGTAGANRTAALLPARISLRNLTIRGGISAAEVRLTVRSFSYRSDLGYYGQARLEGSISAVLSDQAKQRIPAQFRGGAGSINCDFSLGGSVTPGLTGSTALIGIETLGSKDFSLNRLNLLAEWTEFRIRIMSLQNTFPFSAVFDMDLPLDTFSARIMVQNLNPFAMISVRGNYPAARRLAGSRISGTYGVSGSFSADTLSYQARGSCRLPASLVPGGLSAAYEVRGTSTLVTIDGLQVSSALADAAFEGSFDLAARKPSGVATVQRVSLPNGQELDAEVYIEPTRQGIMCFIPQLALGDRNLTALQADLIVHPDSLDFNFEAADYSHSDYDSPGIVRLDGSLMFRGDLYLQAHVATENLFLDSLLLGVSYFLPENSAGERENIAMRLSPYIMSNEIFFETDFSSIIYSIPYSIVASTGNAREFAVFAADGSETSVNLSRLNIIFSNQSIQAQAQVEISPNSYDVFFTTGVTVNKIPYSFSGNFMPGAMLAVTGSYGFSASFYRAQGTSTFSENSWSGSVRMGNFPVAWGKYVFSLSADVSTFQNFTGQQLVLFPYIDVSEMTGLLPGGQRLQISGRATEESVNFESISWTDAVSGITGSGNASWAVKNAVLGSAAMQLSLANPRSSERYDVAVSIRNPGALPFSPGAFLSEYFVSMEGDISAFPLRRVLQNQNPSNVVSGTFRAWGTLEKPYIDMQVADASLSVGGGTARMGGTLAFADSMITASGLDISFPRMTVTDFSGAFSVESFSGSASARYQADLGAVEIEAPIAINFTGGGKAGGNRRALPDTFVVSIASGNAASSLFKSPQSFEIVLSRGADRMDFLLANPALNVSGYLLNSGEISVQVGKQDNIQGQEFVRLNVDGFVRRAGLDVNINDIYVNMAALSPLLSYGVFSLYSAVIAGNMHLGGTPSSPDWSGELTGSNVEINIPQFVPRHLFASQVYITLDQNRLDTQTIPLSLTGSSTTIVNLDLALQFDRWAFDELTLGIKTASNEFLPMDTTMDRLKIQAAVQGDMRIQIFLGAVDIRGSVLGQNGTVEFAALQAADLSIIPVSLQAAPQQSAGRTSNWRVTCALNIVFGSKMQVLVNPLIRGLITPSTVMTLQADTASEIPVHLRGDAVLRGGELQWFNRNFFLREGSIAFTEDVFDPRLTVHAEIRERDDQGNAVRVMVEAENQRLSEFSPRYTASPPKSELEIMALLGQIITGDSENTRQILVAGGDFVFQVTVLRKFENALRELLKFDIFSMRTTFLQNMVNSTWETPEGPATQMTAAKLFDNSTIYVGKYLGNAIYVDALMHFLFDETKFLAAPTSSGLVFQPEIGLEINAPWAILRWSFAPEIDDFDNFFSPAVWVPATSLTLSWRFDLGNKKK